MPRVHHRVFVALAALALLAVLLRPACEIWFAHLGTAAAHAVAQITEVPLGHDGDPQCCASISDAQLIASLQMMSGGMGTAGGVATSVLVSMVAGIETLTRQLQWLRAPPRLPQSFYLRSARILR